MYLFFPSKGSQKGEIKAFCEFSTSQVFNSSCKPKQISWKETNTSLSHDSLQTLYEMYGRQGIYRSSTLCTAEVCWRATFLFVVESSNSNFVVMPVRWILQFYILSRNVFMVSVFQVYFRKGKVLQDSGFVGDALQLFLQCLALDEDFLPAKLEVERVILFMKLDYYLWLDSFIKLPLW